MNAAWSDGSTRVTLARYILPRSGLLLADSKSNSSTRLPLKTTTRVSSGCEASMIILFAMINSLAAHENALRAEMAPPGRATWGVYVGGGKIGERGGERLRGERFSRITAKRPRR